MAKKTSLKAAPRARTGSGLLKQMRREGWIPSVIYGRGVENANLKVDAATFNDMLAHSTSENILINLDIEGEGTRLAFLKSVQHHPITGTPLHVDFIAIDNNTEITAHIPVHFLGEAVGVKAGGLVEHFLHSIDIICLPNDLPEVIDVDISDLDLGAVLHIGDIKFPPGVKPTGAADVVVAHITKHAGPAAEEPAAAEGAA